MELTMLNQFKMLSQNVLNLFGKPNNVTISEKREAVLRSLDPKTEKRARTLRRKLFSPEKYASVVDYYADHDEYNSILKNAVSAVKANKKMPKQLKDTITSDYADYYQPGTTPAGSSFYDVFFNPFAIYSYLNKHHPVVFRAVDIIREEIANDGFALKSAEGVPKREMRRVYRLLKEAEIERLRLNIASHLKLYGNAWLIEENKKLKLLMPTKLKAVVDPETDEIIGWQYKRGRTTKNYTLEDMHHLWLFNAEADKAIGDPPLQAALLDIETDLSMKTYNKQLLETGWLGSVVFSMEDVESTEGDEMGPTNQEVAKKVSDMINSEVAGAMSGGRAMVLSHLKDAKNLSPIGSVEAAFNQSIQERAKIICMCLGVPCEKLGFSRSDTVQYVPTFVEYSVNASFDKSIYCLVGMIDDFINDTYMAKIQKIEGIRIQASGRFGSLTKTAAEVIKILAEAGPLITVNQALELILGFEPLSPDNPRGNWVLDNTKGRMEGLNSSEVPRYPGLVDPAKEDYELAANRTKISYQTFFDEIACQVKSGKYERKDITTASEETKCTSMVIRTGRAHQFFFETKIA